MPKSVLSYGRVQSMLAHPLERSELEALLFASKAELSGLEGDELTIEVTPDRLDLLSEGGLGLYLQGRTGAAHGVPALTGTPASDPPMTIVADASVSRRRPYIAAVALTAPTGEGLDAGLLAEGIRFQELLHATVGADRRLASLGIYPYDRLRPPIHYRLEPIGAIRFTPLGAEKETSAEEFFSTHPMAARYGEMGREGGLALTLRDRERRVLSLPPVLNSREGGEARVGDRALLLESTGTLKARVKDALSLLSLVFVARGWRLTAVPVSGSHGPDTGESLVSLRRLHLPAATVAQVGGAGYSAASIEHELSRARLSASPEAHGWSVAVPPWRPDLLSGVDLAEEVVLSRGLRAEDGLIPPSSTRGRRLPERRFADRFSELFRGLGFAELYTPVLVSETSTLRTGRSSAIALRNPVSDQFAYLRDRLFVSLTTVLEHNLRTGYPQRFAEVGPVVVPDTSADTGAATRQHAGAVIASEGAGFADAAALLDFLLRDQGVAAVREPVEIPRTIPGRAARVKLAGEVVGELGELSPELLAELGVPVPAVWAELNLTALWPLLRRGESR
ncbi:MAG: hypothetical protein L3K09_01230 [Thermoplasmata archaeon]|nr:hypothetical protein [Thermoplasmata archaeon]